MGPYFAVRGSLFAIRWSRSWFAVRGSRFAVQV